MSKYKKRFLILIVSIVIGMLIALFNSQIIRPRSTDNTFNGPMCGASLDLNPGMSDYGFPFKAYKQADDPCDSIANEIQVAPLVGNILFFSTLSFIILWLAITLIYKYENHRY